MDRFISDHPDTDMAFLQATRIAILAPGETARAGEVVEMNGQRVQFIHTLSRAECDFRRAAYGFEFESPIPHGATFWRVSLD